jgi:hypothetical protein
MKRCRRCQQIRPLDQFRRRYTGTENRHALCKACFNEDAAQRRATKRFKTLHEHNKRINRQAQSVAIVVAATAEIVGRFGGVDGFVTAWKEALDRASADGKPHLVVRGMSMVVHLINTCETIRESGPQPDELDDEDLRWEMERCVTRIVQQNPELAISAARRLGWTIAPNEEHAEEVMQV